MDSQYFSRVAITAVVFAAVVLLASIEHGTSLAWRMFFHWFPSTNDGKTAETIAALAGAGVIASAIGSIFDRLSSLFARIFHLEPDEYAFISKLSDELSKTSPFFNGLPPIGVYHVIYSAEAPGGLAEWRHRRRVQLYFNLNCIVAMTAGLIAAPFFGPAWCSWFCVALVVLLFLSALLYLNHFEHRFDREAAEVWVSLHSTRFHTKPDSSR